MKTNVGSRSFVEMYLITKEDKSLFDKCVLHLNKKTQEEIPLTHHKTKDEQVQTIGVLSNNNNLENSDIQSSEESIKSVQEGKQKVEAGSSKDVDHTPNIAETKQSSLERTKKSKNKRKRAIVSNPTKASNHKIEKEKNKLVLLSPPYSPINTRNKKISAKKKTTSKNTYFENRKSSLWKDQYPHWSRSETEP